MINKVTGPKNPLPKLSQSMRSCLRSCVRLTPRREWHKPQRMMADTDRLTAEDLEYRNALQRRVDKAIWTLKHDAAAAKNDDPTPEASRKPGSDHESTAPCAKPETSHDALQKVLELLDKMRGMGLDAKADVAEWEARQSK